MFAVIFEVTPRPERWDEYLDHARRLRPELEQVDGFLLNERFRDRAVPGCLLSLSLWRDAKSVIRWRTVAAHHAVQARSRAHVFADYHLRVGEVIADSQDILPPPQHHEATETGRAKVLAIAIGEAGEAPVAPAQALEASTFDSITTQGRWLVLAGWPDADAARDWTAAGCTRRMQVRIERDYGMFDRREAPQYFPPAQRG